MTPGPETSCNMTLSTLANITSPGESFSLPDALASIFSVIVIPTKIVHTQCVRLCLYDGLKPLEHSNIKHKRHRAVVVRRYLVVEILPISIKTQKSRFDLFGSLQGFAYKYNDIVVISSKFVSMSEGSIVKLSNIKVKKRAQALANQNHMDATIAELVLREDRKSTRLNSSHANISYAVFCL